MMTRRSRCRRADEILAQSAFDKLCLDGERHYSTVSGQAALGITACKAAPFAGVDWIKHPCAGLECCPPRRRSRQWLPRLSLRSARWRAGWPSPCV